MKSKSLAASVVLLLGSVYGASAFAADNPVDHAGIQHNMYLNCLLEGGVGEREALAYIVEKCGYDPGLPLDEYVKANQPILDMDPLMPLAEKLAPVRDRYSAYEFSFFERIDAIVASGVDLDQAQAGFAELEREAIARLDPKSAGGKNILGGLSVLRHSTRYWADYAAAYPNAGAAETGRMRWWKWLIVAVVDAGTYWLSEDVGTSSGASGQACTWLNGSSCPIPLGGIGGGSDP